MLKDLVSCRAESLNNAMIWAGKTPLMNLGEALRTTELSTTVKQCFVVAD